ncbi:type IV pilus biogenesis/stability protein PilW [Dyella solisilvae]|uniref:Type IV pilus biogenesis/stability protein PilW n=1 Tax=Dyella solisilvae TaxID=1920168 RepID=A0A370K419_9GAMM|nr:type IV pilus biogenesis/stability protein PilW [Dyella solisilvae]RDI97392.1 type IV pilus biogenesis/stability protein PilW [Dyella solisilvae]
MRLDRILLSAGLAMLLAGCVTTTTTDAGGVSTKIPRTSKAEQKQEGARIHTDLAQQYLTEGDLQDALVKVNKAFTFDPNYVPAHTIAAVIYERINDLPNAELHYRKAQALAPQKGDTNNNLGWFLCNAAGKPAEAMPFFQKAVADPFYQTPALALTNAGACLVRSHDLAGAEVNFRKALEIDPQNGGALYQLANVLYLQNDAFRARAFIQRFDALGQPSASALKLGHDIESRLGNRDAALNYSRRLQSQFPDSEQARALDATARQ